MQLRGCREAWSASGILFVLVKAVLLSGEVFEEIHVAPVSTGYTAAGVRCRGQPWFHEAGSSVRGEAME
jgi:hypothetical protein